MFSSAGPGIESVAETAIEASWRRCVASGLDPSADVPVELVDAALEDYRAAHPLAVTLPVIRRLLMDHAVDDGLVVAVTDAAGRLLWVEGQSGALRRAEGMHFLGGARWDESHAGTNAPALALALDLPTRVRNEEHWAAKVQGWSCSAAPVHDPVTGALLGALDVTGDDRAASNAAFALVRATAAAVEQDLLVRSLRHTGAGVALAPDTVELALLGPMAATLRTWESPAAQHLSLRHAEILLLLTAHPEGLTAEELAVRLDERDLDPVTVRAECSRLRRVAGLPALLARPYRLAESLGTDVARVRALLDAGRLAEAVSRYAGPLLPRSQAPAVVRMRDELAAEVRGAVIGAGDPAVLRVWAEGPAGEDDPGVWAALARCLPPGPGHDRARARAVLLDLRLG